MKKITKWAATIALPSAVFLTIASCQKESTTKSQEGMLTTSSSSHNPVTRAYRDSFSNQLGFSPDFSSGYTPPNIAPGWYHGEGDGNAAHMGKAKIFFCLYTTFGQGGLINIAAPVTDFYGSQLAAAGYTGIPATVSNIVYDDKGNSIWFHQTSFTNNPNIPDGPTRVNFLGTMHIIGGTGKFSGAAGSVTIQGHFNPQNFNEDQSWQNGWISY